MEEVMNPLQLQDKLNKMFPDLKFMARYGELGIEIRCRWELSMIVDLIHAEEEIKLHVLKAIYEHIGKMTRIVYELEHNDEE